MKKYSGFTTDTAKSLLLNAGAYFKNFDIDEDTFDSAVAAGKLLGATLGGGEFSAVPTIRQIEVDGIAGRAKGLEVVDSWEVYLKANVLEIKKDTLVAGLVSADVDTTTNTDYDIVTARNNIELTDYIENITWVGTLSGSDDPVVIVVKNALNNDGLTLTTQDKNQAVISMTFYGHYTQNDLDTPPFEIYYPKASASTSASSGTSGN